MNMNDGSISYSVRGLVTFTTNATGQALKPLNPNIIAQLAPLASSFSQYRFRRLRVQLLPMVSTTNATAYAFGVLAGSTDAAATALTLANVTGLAFSEYLPKAQTTPLLIDVPRRYLVDDNSAKWWKSQQGSNDVWDANQGYFLLATGTAAVDIFNVMIEADVEFSVPATTALIPAPQGPSASSQPARENLVGGHLPAGPV
jgi:hypothetical protein